MQDVLNLLIDLLNIESIIDKFSSNFLYLLKLGSLFVIPWIDCFNAEFTSENLFNNSWTSSCACIQVSKDDKRGISFEFCKLKLFDIPKSVDKIVSAILR